MCTHPSSISTSTLPRFRTQFMGFAYENQLLNRMNLGYKNIYPMYFQDYDLGAILVILTTFWYPIVFPGILDAQCCDRHGICHPLYCTAGNKLLCRGIAERTWNGEIKMVSCYASGNSQFWKRGLSLTVWHLYIITY